MKKQFAFILLIVSVFFLGFGLCFTLSKIVSQSLVKNVDNPLAQGQPNFDVNTSRHFFSEDINVYGKDDKGIPFFLKLSLNRKQNINGEFSHYYFSKLKYGGINKSSYVDFDEPTSQVTAQKIFTSYRHNYAEDLSTRDNYDFSLNLDGYKLDLLIDDLNGDFLIRNLLEYTKYGSVGQAKIKIAGKSFMGKAFVTKIDSSDYSKYIYFDDFDNLSAVTDYLFFWDELGNFYLIDKTISEKGQKAYPSHTLVLYKDAQANWVKKVFDLKIDFKEEKDLPKSWWMMIPALNAEVNLNIDGFFKNSLTEGFGSGTVKNAGGTFLVEGFLERLK